MTANSGFSFSSSTAASNLSRRPLHKFDIIRKFSSSSVDALKSNSSNREWLFRNKRKIIFWIVSGVLICSTYYASKETVPYTNRTRFVCVPAAMMDLLDDFVFQRQLGDYLPETDPESARMMLILNDIIKALSGDGMRKGATTKHLNGLPWQVVIGDFKSLVGSPAASLSNGIILFSTKSLKEFTTDAEIAAIIGHEVAHVVARHQAERLTKAMGYRIFRWFTWMLTKMFFDWEPVLSLHEKVKLRPDLLAHHREIEADYIGAVLLASAGYDPHIAVGVYKKVGQLYCNSRNCRSVMKNRVESLSHALEEPFKIYNKSLTKKQVQEEL